MVKISSSFTKLFLLYIQYTTLISKILLSGKIILRAL